MRLVKKTINESDGSGSATLIPQEPEDMWHLYNLIRPGDIVRAPATRKVHKDRLAGANESVSANRASASSIKVVHTVLTTRVIRTDFDAAAGELHIAGRVIEENTYVPIGSHHTLDLELDRQLTLSKGGDDSGDGWDSVALMTLNQATDMRKRAEVYAVVMQEGLANICVITEHQTLLRQRIETTIPRKRAGAGADAHEKGLTKFFDTTLATLLRQLDPSVLSADTKSPPLLLASPGFTAAAFHKHMLASAERGNNKPLLQYARASVLVAHSSTGHVHALSEILRSPAVLAKLSDTRYARESALMERFMELVRADDGRAWYGPREVERAVDKGAVGRGGGVLLINNQLFRAQDVAERRRWVDLVERVRDREGGEVRVLSSAHESGKRLEGLGNVGAILTFPLLDLDEEDEEEEEAGAGPGGGRGVIGVGGGQGAEKADEGEERHDIGDGTITDGAGNVISQSRPAAAARTTRPEETEEIEI